MTADRNFNRSFDTYLDESTSKFSKRKDSLRKT